MAKDPAITGTDLASIRAYAVKHDYQLFLELFYGFRTAKFFQPYINVKGKVIMTRLEFIQDLARRYNCKPENLHTVAKLMPKELEVITSSIDGELCPKTLEKTTYLGDMYQKGQNNMAFPFEKKIFGTMLKKLQQELEMAIWRAKKTDTPLPDDFLKQLFDGIAVLYKKAVDAGNATMQATGAIDQSNILPKFKLMYAHLDDEVKAMGVDIYCSMTLRDEYVAAKEAGNYKLEYLPVPGAKGYDSVVYEKGGGLTHIHALPGLSGTDAVFMTPRGNFGFLTDDHEDYKRLQFRENKRMLEFWGDFNFGAGIAVEGTGIIVGNDKAFELGS